MTNIQISTDAEYEIREHYNATRVYKTLAASPEHALELHNANKSEFVCIDEGETYEHEIVQVTE